MTARLVPLPEDAAALVRPSKRVAWVAEALDCDEDQVRALLDSGELQGHGIGKRGVRIFLDSVRDYQERRIRKPGKPAAARQKPAPAVSSAARAAQAAALAELRRAGLA